MSVPHTTTYRGRSLSYTLVVAALVALTLAGCGPDMPAVEPGPSLFPLETLWSTDLGAPSSASPAYTETMAFAPVRDGRVLAVNLESGSIRWTATLDTTIAPATSEQLVFVATTGALDALRQDDGTQAWRTPIPAPVAAPLHWQGGWLIAGLDNGTVLGLRAEDGQEMWKQELGAPSRVQPAIEAGHVFVSLTDGRVVALNVENGQIAWERKLGDAAGRPLPLADRVFVGSSDNFFYCLNRENGDIRWRWRTGADGVGTAVVDDDRVYFVSMDNELRALDRRSGVQRWRKSLPLRPSTGPLRLGELLLVSGLSSTLVAFHTQDGSQAADYASSSEIVAPPHVVAPGLAGQGLVIVTESGHLQRLGRGVEPPVERLRRLPGVELEPEPAPEQSLEETFDVSG